MMRFILTSKEDEHDNAEIVTDIDKLTVKDEFARWLEEYVDEGSFSDYISEKYPDKLVIDLNSVEDYSFDV